MEKKIIYVDVDGCICTTSYDIKDFKDIESSYINVEPYLDRIEHINRLFDEGHHIVYWTARGCKSGLDMTNITKTQLERWGAKYSDLQFARSLLANRIARINEDIKSLSTLKDTVDKRIGVTKQ